MKMLSPLYVMLFGLIAFGLLPAMAEKWESFEPSWAIKQGNQIYEYMPFRQSELIPEVCIMKPSPNLIDYNDYKDSIWYGIAAWEEILNEMSGWFNPDRGYAWHLKILEYDYEEHITKEISDYIQCNIFIVFEPFNEEREDTLGITYFDYANSRHKYAVITIYSTQPVPSVLFLDEDPEKWETEVDILPLTPDTMRQVISHEIGHGLGLGHYYGGMNTSGRSIMEFSMSTWNEDNYIPPQYLDAYALIIKYGTDGFKVWEMGVRDKWFIPPHPALHT